MSSGYYEKRQICLTCHSKMMADESEANAHKQLGHVTKSYSFGGYKKPVVLEAPKEEISWLEEENG